MKETDQIAAEAAEAYYKYEADAWDIYLGHRDKLQAIIKTAIEKALSGQRIYGEWGTAVVINDEFSSVKGRAAHASEPLRLLNYWYRERGSIAKEAYDEIKHALESNCAAHASEPWIGGRCKFCNEDEGRHKPDCRAAQASEQE